MTGEKVMNELEVMNIEYYPSIDEISDYKNYVTFPKSQLESLGLIGSSFIEQTGTITTELNMDGLYSVSIPKGLHLSKFKDGSGLSTMLRDKSNNLKAQARLNKVDGITSHQTYTVPYNPATACIALMLMSLDKKLNVIQESQQEMLSILKTHEHGEIKGNIQYLYDILKNLKTRYADDQYKKEYRLKTQDIIQDAYKYIEIYKESITSKIGKEKVLHTSIQSDKEIAKLADEFAYYRLAVFMFVYAHYVELLLGDYIDENIIDAAQSKLNNLNIEYRKLYTELYDFLDKVSKNSIDKKAINFLGNASKGMGNIIHKMPLIEKGPVDETLVSLGNYIQNINEDNLIESLERLRNYKSLNIDGFIKQYDKLSVLYSGSTKILFDHDNIYVSKQLLN